MQNDESMKWDSRFLDLAAEVAKWSKDPSTQVGAVIVRPDRTIASVGYNGFPRGMLDDPSLLANREEKLSRTIHGEMNAILNAGERVRGCTLYTYPFLTCDRCAVHVIQAGIVRVVCPVATGERAERWAASFARTRDYYRMCGVQVVELDYL